MYVVVTHALMQIRVVRIPSALMSNFVYTQPNSIWSTIMQQSLSNLIYMAVPNAGIYESNDLITIAVDTHEDAVTVGIILELHS